MTQANWSDDRVEQLKTLWTEGLSSSDPARALGGVTRNAVIGKVHRLGLAGRASPSRSERPRLPMAPKVPSVRSHVPAAPVVEEDPLQLEDGQQSEFLQGRKEPAGGKHILGQVPGVCQEVAGKG